jgi:hypothetical protein
MENEKLQINMAPGMEKAEVIFREVESVNELPIKAPIKIDLTGVIGAPVEFLKMRLSDTKQINPSRCHVLVSREKLTIALIFNEDDEYNHGKVVGVLEQHPKFKEFGINTGKCWDSNELGQFCKMHRAFFITPTENMDLVTKLKSFEAKVTSLIEKEKKESGDFKDNYSGVVTSNLPGAFKLSIPLFKGRPKEEIEVEFYASVDGRTVKLQLYSPGACQALEDLRDEVIDTQIKAIKELSPTIPVIEQ